MNDKYKTEKEEIISTDKIMEEMLRTAIKIIKNNYDIDYGKGASDYLINNYGSIMLNKIVPKETDPGFLKLLSDIVTRLVGKDMFFEIENVLIPPCFEFSECDIL